MVRRIEDMTLGEISDRVEEENGRQEQAERRVFDQIAKETAQKIVGILSKPKTAAHKFIPYGSKHIEGCVRCHYSKDHEVHKGHDESDSKKDVPV